MNEQATFSSTEISLTDILDGINKARGSLGYLADGSRDHQLTSILMLIEESLGITEQGLQYIINKGIGEEVQEDIPFE